MLALALNQGDCVVIGDATSPDAIVISCVRVRFNKTDLAFHLPSSVRCDRLEVAKIRLEGIGKKLARHIELIASGNIQQLKTEKRELENRDKTTN